MEINFKAKIKAKRFYSNKKNESQDRGFYPFESDRGRIINSAAIRRLQQKTQVFPLERNAVVRSRLTHSLEVQQVGRFIVKEMFKSAQQKNFSKVWHLSDCEIAIESLVEMACLMHDIGNPPFGHFGEAAINDWFIKQFKDNVFDVVADDLNDAKSTKILKSKIKADLSHFEGNAQAIRLVHSLLNLNLTYAQIASILKYTRPAYFDVEKIPNQYRYLMKKPGFYLSEEVFIKELMSELEMAPYHRYPLTYIMEAADDISYCIADLEDSVEKSILTVESLYTHLKNEWGESVKGDLFDLVVERAYVNFTSQKNYYATAVDDFFMYLRVNTVTKLVPHAVERFIENIDSIYAGSFNEALLEDRGAEFKLLDMFKRVGFKHVFNHSSVENAELQGFKIISGLLGIYGALLMMPEPDFTKLVHENNHNQYRIETRLFHKLPDRYGVAYKKAISQLNRSESDFVIWEFYYRARLIQDYISGMTDHFAFDEFRRLNVMD